MATISGLNLQLVSHDHATNVVTLRVTYRALFGPVERGMAGLRYREEISLRGADPGSDPTLFHFFTTSFAVDPDGSVNRTRTVTLSEDIVDEDMAIWPFTDGTDEVYARVRLTPLMPAGAVRHSNEVHHKF